MEKNNKKRKVIKILLALVIVGAIGSSYMPRVFAADSNGELEREFVIDVNSPDITKDREENITVDVNSPSLNPAETGNGFIIDVNKPKEGSTIDRKSTRLNSSHVSTSYAVFCSNTNTVPPD